jgi:hypothetical protein
MTNSNLKFNFFLSLMMGVCDSRRRFIWVEVRMPGAASDFYAFDESDLKKKLDKEGFLRPGCVFLATMRTLIHGTCALRGEMLVPVQKMQ